MSEIERNKGKLIPVLLEEIKAEYPDADLEDLEWCTYDKYTQIKGLFFKIEWEVRSEKDDYFFTHVDRNEDGSIDFHTLHYNGGGHWKEIIGEKI